MVDYTFMINFLGIVDKAIVGELVELYLQFNSFYLRNC